MNRPGSAAGPLTLSWRNVRLTRGLVIVSFALALAWPALRHPTEQVLGSARTDTVKHVWTLWMGRRMLLDEGTLSGHTFLANYPHGFHLFIIEPLGAVISAGLAPLPVVLVANFLSVLNLVLLGFATAWLGDHLAGGRLPGLLAACLVMGSAVTAFFFRLGVGELQHIFLLPLALLLSSRIAVHGSWRDTVLLGLVLGLTVASGFYLGLFASIAVTVISLARLLRGPRRLGLGLRLLAAAGLAVAVAWPFVMAFRASWPVRAIVPKHLYQVFDLRRPPVEHVWARLDLARLVWPVHDNFGSAEPNYLGGQYLGPILLGLAGLGLVRRWRRGWPLALTALSGLVLAMGTRPIYAGQELEIPLLADGVLPYAWLQWLLSATGITPHYPSRFIVLAVIALAGLAALALADITRPTLRALAIGLVVLGIVDVAERTTQAWPWPVATRPPVTGLSTLAAEDSGAIVDLAYFSTRDLDARNRAAWYQTAHGLPTQAVAISQLDELNTEGAATVLAVPLIFDLRQLRSTGAKMKPNQDYQADLALLRADGFRWLMAYRSAQTDMLGHVTRSPTPPPRQLAALNHLLGIPFLQDEGFAVWHIPMVDISASALAEAQRSRDARIEQVRDRIFERASPREAPAQ